MGIADRAGRLFEERRNARNELTNPAPAPAPAPAGGGITWDPQTQNFINIATQQMGRLSQPFSDPNLDEVTNLLRGQLGGLTSAGPVSFSASNGLLGDFINQGRQRIGELNQEPFSQAEEGRYRTQALDSVERNRTANLQRAKENAARRGLADTSGILLEMEGNINNATASDRTKAETDLAMFLTNERNRRKDLATQISGQLAQAGAADAGLQLQAQTSAATVNQARQGQIMGMAGMLADLAAQQRGEARGRQNDVLAIAQTLANLAPQRLAQLSGMVNGNDQSSLFSNTLNLNNSIQNQNNVNSAAQGQSTAALMQILGYIAANRGQ